MTTNLPASLFADWHSNDPQRMLVSLRRIGVSEDRIDKWCELCEQEYRRRTAIGHGSHQWWKAADSSVSLLKSFSHATPYLSCLFGSEFAGEWEECKSCGGSGEDQRESTSGDCQHCRGLGVVRATVGPGRFDADYLLGAVEYRLCIPLIDPRWRTSTVLDLVRQIAGACPCELKHEHNYQWEMLPILADALEDAGCDNADLLEHCRSGGPHVVGECWVMLELLGN